MKLKMQSKWNMNDKNLGIRSVLINSAIAIFKNSKPQAFMEHIAFHNSGATHSHTLSLSHPQLAGAAVPGQESFFFPQSTH